MMVGELGGDKKILSEYNTILNTTKYIGEINSDTSGFLVDIKTRELGLTLIEMGGGRKQIKDSINYSVGFSDVASLNSKIAKGMTLMKVHTYDEESFKSIEKKLKDCFSIKEKKINNKTIIDIIN